MLHGIPPRADLLKLRAERDARGDPAPVALDEGAGAGEERADLLGGEGGEQREAGGRQRGGQTDTDVGDQVGAAGRALLEDVEDVAAVQDRQMRVVAGRADEAVQGEPGESSQALLSLEGGAQFVGGDAQAVSALIGQVGDIAARSQHREQVIDA